MENPSSMSLLSP